MKKNFFDPDWKKHLPIPVCEDNSEYGDFYMKAWELAHDHIKSIDGMPQDPYMDEAFCDTHIWIWDSCFMAQFCKLAQSVFPGVETLKNFYEVLYDGRSLPQIYVEDKEPEWTEAVPFSKNPIYVHIADNPPLFAWSEYENAIISGDTEHLRELLYEKKYLQKHYMWFEGLKTTTKPSNVFAPTCLISEDIGYRWEGGRSGMDNTPRGRDVPHNGKERPNNPNLLWLDAICQQALSARMIARLFAILEDTEGEAEWNNKFLEKKDIVNKYYWDEDDGFYYDYDIGTGKLCKVMTAASYWVLTAGIATRERAKKLAKRLSDPETLGGDVPLLSLARNDGDYYSDGHYWRGALWLPTAYAALKGLSDYGFHREAHIAARRILDHMLATYKEFEPHTIWECYAPEAHAPATTTDGKETVRKDFCGWSALGPISVYLEFVLGFRRLNAFDKTLDWEKPEDFTGEIGVRNLQFGDIVTDIVAKGNICRVTSNQAYTLRINGKSYDIDPGKSEFELQ